LWYAETGCPMLLNTSLNVKGEPIVNTMDDYKNFIKWSGLNDLS
jgi:carbamoyltransferase